MSIVINLLHTQSSNLNKRTKTKNLNQIQNRQKFQFLPQRKEKRFFFRQKSFFIYQNKVCNENLNLIIDI